MTFSISESLISRLSKDKRTKSGKISIFPLFFIAKFFFKIFSTIYTDSVCTSQLNKLVQI